MNTFNAICVSLIAFTLASCSKENPSLPPVLESIRVFGKPFSYSWAGAGELLINPQTKCESVVTTISTASEDVVVVKDTRIKCAGREFIFPDRKLRIDATAGATYENGERVGDAQHYLSEYYGRWFTFRIDLPELGTDALYMSLMVWAPGTFSDVKGPVLDLEIAAKPDGSLRGFMSHLYPLD
jgi:hypothetical protein